MKRRPRTMLAMLALAFWTPGPALPQTQQQIAAPPNGLSPEGLDQVVAPIALYSDDLLGQVLTAATYPLEVVEAARWREAPADAALTGDALAAALAVQDWDPSVKALVPFPTILETMYERLRWTETLGDAFLSQPADLMDAIQRLRRRAEQTGTLASTADQTVGSDGEAVTIESTDPDAIAFPYYDPRLTYGTWPDPDAPPDYFMPPSGYVEEPALFFFAPVVIIPVLRHLYHCDWHHHRLEVDVARFNAVDHDAEERRQRPPSADATWQHDPFHRHGVAYRDPALRAKFAPATTGGAETRRDFSRLRQGARATARYLASGRPGGEDLPAACEPRAAANGLRRNDTCARRPRAGGTRPPELAWHTSTGTARADATARAATAGDA
ncbi:MAG TPA: DUF3300 domain-containing protein [Stellaceae bacterium]|nr:DUF3300 domain-containing protein [Stellaceae bacterium]